MHGDIGKAGRDKADGRIGNITQGGTHTRPRQSQVIDIRQPLAPRCLQTQVVCTGSEIHADTGGVGPGCPGAGCGEADIGRGDIAIHYQIGRTCTDRGIAPAQGVLACGIHADFPIYTAASRVGRVGKPAAGKAGVVAINSAIHCTKTGLVFFDGDSSNSCG